MRPTECVVTQSDRFLYKKRGSGHTKRHQRSVCTEEGPCEDTERVAIYKPMTEASEETKPIDTSVLNC